MSLGVVYENKPEITPSEPDQGNACEGNRPPMHFSYLLANMHFGFYIQS
jgi:hypothetical protein